MSFINKKYIYIMNNKEELFKVLIKELFEMEEVHYEYNENNNSYVLDSNKEGDTLTIKVQLKENEDKKEFEQWVDQMDDDIFNETYEALSEEDTLHSLNDIYNSPNYKEVINKFKSKAKEIAQNKVNSLTKLFDLD